MSLTPSTMMPLGTIAPGFELPNTSDSKTYSLEEMRGERGTLIYFICNHCPYVIHVMEELVRISDEYKTLGINTIAISSNDIINYPADAPDKMKLFSEKYIFNFPYLYDESQEVAKSYDAACTPDIFLFNYKLECFYRGRLDGSRPGNDIPIDGQDLRNALKELLKGNEYPVNQIPSAGCNIKWKS